MTYVTGANMRVGRAVHDVNRYTYCAGVHNVDYRAIRFIDDASPFNIKLHLHCHSQRDMHYSRVDDKGSKKITLCYNTT